MRIDSHGTGDGLYSFRGLNSDPDFVPEGPSSAREVTNAASLRGFFQRYTPKADTSGKGAMRQLLDELKGDLSQESIDRWVATHKDQLQRIGGEQGLSGQAVSLARNADGTWTVGAADGESRTFALLDAEV